MRHDKRLDCFRINQLGTLELGMIQPNEKENLENEIEWNVIGHECENSL
jgi:hypothetical protein